MLNVWQHWYQATFGTRHRRRSQRQVGLQFSHTEVLEQRALMSATNGMAEVADTPDEVSYMALDAEQPESAALTGDDARHSIKTGSQQRHGPRAKLEIPDFNGRWILGFDNQTPQPDSLMKVTQNGKKVTATINDNGLTALVKGRIKQGELRAKFTVPENGAFGSLTIRRTDADSFSGVITITIPGDGTRTQTLDGNQTNL